MRIVKGGQQVFLIWMLTAYGASGQTGEKQKFRESFIRGCQANLDTTRLNNMQKKLVHNYCVCAAETLLQRFSVAELHRMQIQRTAETTSDADKRIADVIKPCSEQLKAAVDSLKPLR